MNPEDDHMRRTQLYLRLDPDELANVTAEIAKRSAQRRAAMAYADENSQLHPVTFAPNECIRCQDPIMTANTSPDKNVCLWCHKPEKPERKRIAWGDVVFWLTVGVAVIGLVAWVVA